MNELTALSGAFRTVLGGSVQLVSAPDGTDFLIAAVRERFTTARRLACDVSHLRFTGIIKQYSSFPMLKREKAPKGTKAFERLRCTRGLLMNGNSPSAQWHR